MAKKKVTKKKVEDSEEVKPKKKAKTTKAKAEPELDENGQPVKKKRKTRKKKTDDIRRKLFWGVYNHAMKLVAKYDFNQKKAAEKRAEELSPEGKPPHFVQKLKEDVIIPLDPDAPAEEAAPAKAAKKKAKK